MLHIEWHHLAHAEAEHRNGLAGAGGQGIEVEHKDADCSIGHHQGYSA